MPGWGRLLACTMPTYIRQCSISRSIRVRNEPLARREADQSLIHLTRERVEAM